MLASDSEMYISQVPEFVKELVSGDLIWQGRCLIHLFLSKKKRIVDDATSRDDTYLKNSTS